MNQQYDHLIDHDSINVAKTNLASVQGRRGPAQERLAVAKRRQAAAHDRHDVALAGDSGQDPASTAVELNAATTVHDVAIAALPAIEGAIVRAHDHLKEQTGVAHQPVVSDGVARYFAACRLAEEGRAVVNKATADFHDAVAQIRHAGAHGAHFPHDNHLEHGSPALTKVGGAFEVPTFDEAVARFAAAAGRFPGVDGSGNLK